MHSTLVLHIYQTITPVLHSDLNAKMQKIMHSTPHEIQNEQKNPNEFSFQSFTLQIVIQQGRRLISVVVINIQGSTGVLHFRSHVAKKKIFLQFKVVL